MEKFNRSLFATTALCLAAFLSGCHKENKSDDNPRNLENAQTTFLYNAIPDDPGAAISSEYSAAVNTFSANLLKTLYAAPEINGTNVVVSPYSIERNLAVLTEGASGNTRDELLSALGGQVALDDAKEALTEILYADESVIFQSADGLWIDSANFTVAADYKETINSEYGVEITGMDFSDPSAVVSSMNEWIETNTNEYCSGFMEEENIGPNSALFLVNAIYFEADWTSPFDVTRTYSAPFESPDGQVTVDMMSSDYVHAARIRETWENVRIYYGTSGADFFYLDVYKPITTTVDEFLANDALEALSTSPTAEDWPMSLAMPKFFFESELDLIPALQELGVRDVFDPDRSDLSGMINENEILYVSEIRHQAGIKTDEEGTRAYAVTETTTAKLTSGGPESILLDRPFVYFIRAGQNGLVLFAGVVNDPTLE